MESDGLCRCGCGGKAKIATKTSTRNGWIKGQPQHYLRGHASWKDHGPRWIEDANGCWIWQRSFNNQGYPIGGFVKNGKAPGSHLAHRSIYEQSVGPIPEGLELDHTCFIPACVNPAHLEPVTPEENLRRRRTHSKKLYSDDLAKAWELRQTGLSWRKIAIELGVTHGPLTTRMRAYCEQSGLPYR